MGRFRIILALLVGTTLLGTVSSSAQHRRGADGYPARGACFFKDADFGGGHFCVPSGQSRSEMPNGFNDKISSIRVFGKASVALFKDHNFQGTRVEVHHDIADFSRVKGGNDKISSLRVF